MSIFRQAFRSLAWQPGFSMIAILTLALGIGATTSMYTVLDAVILQPLPYPESDRLVVVQTRSPQFPNPISLSVLNYPDVRDQLTTVGRLGVVRTITMNLTGTDEPARIPAKMISADVLDTLRVPPLMGRAFTAEDDKAGAPAVALVSHGFWQTRLGGAADVVGRTVNLDGALVSIVGVMPAHFRIFSPADVYIPAWPWLSSQPPDRSYHPGLVGIARLADNVSLDRAQQELAGISDRLEQAYPEDNRGFDFIAVPAHTVMVQNVRSGLFVLAGAVGGVLLIACINVAGLLLARGLARRRDMAVRTALGAQRRDIMRLVLGESLLLALAGAALGLVLASALVPLLVEMVGATLPRAETVAINGRVLGFTLGLSVISALLFGVLPSLSSSRVDLRDVLSESSRGSSGGRRQQLARRLLVTAEIAVTMALLVGAGLLMRSFLRLQDVSPGFAVDRLLVAGVPLSPQTYGDHATRTAAVNTLLDQLRAQPGVSHVAATTLLPMSGPGMSLHFNIQGRQPRSSADWIMLHPRAVTHGYFETMGMSLTRGRAFSEADREGSPYVAVVTEAFARQFFPGDDPLGKRISFGTVYDGGEPWREIVGVVGDVLQAADDVGRSELFVPYEQHPADFFTRVYLNVTVALRTSGDPLALASALRRTVREVDPNQPIVNLRSMDQHMSASVAQPRFRTTLLGVFAGLALLLAGIGIYGLLAHGVTQRRGEFGVRLALGASAGQVVGLVVREGLLLAAIGLVCGTVAAIFAVRLVQTMLFGVTLWDVPAWSLSGIALILVALLASWIPARRAGHVAPALTLRS